MTRCIFKVENLTPPQKTMLFKLCLIEYTILHLETKIRMNLFIDLWLTILSQKDNFTTRTCKNRPQDQRHL